MDSRDNRQHRIRHQQVVPSYSGAVAPIYSGVDKAMAPVLEFPVQLIKHKVRQQRRQRAMLEQSDMAA